MTYNELRSEVCALGFESDIESEERLLFAARRALNIIFTERPLYKNLSISKPKMTPIFKKEKLEHRGGEREEFEFNAKAFSFISSGVGYFTVTDELGERRWEFGTREHVHRGFLHGGGSIRFEGDYSYTVYSLALFDELYGEDITDIPLLDGFHEYKISDYVNDFLACCSAPENDSGYAIEGASVSAGVISIPESFSGRVNLRYKASPVYSGEIGDENITLPDGCEHLLPLLVSAYVWLDDDTEKSEYYMMLYREGMAAVRAYNRSAADFEYTVKDGWA